MAKHEDEINQGSNISVTATALKKKEREEDIQPGTPEWFKLWFSLPYLNSDSDK